MRVDKNKIIKLFLIAVIIGQFFFIANNRVNFDIEILKNSFSKDFGAERVLPKEIIELKKIVLKKNIKKTNLSEYLRNNVFFYQRTVEFLYPIKIDKGNDKIFYSVDEKIPQKCEILKKYNYLIWVQC